jgi:hypothetical protein
MKGDEFTRLLRADPDTSEVPVVYMSAIGVDLHMDQEANPNVIGFLNKPFTSDLLIKTVENHMPKSPDEPGAAADTPPAPFPPTDASEFDPGVQSISTAAEDTPAVEPAPAQPEEWWSSPQRHAEWSEASPTSAVAASDYQSSPVSPGPNEAE